MKKYKLTRHYTALGEYLAKKRKLAGYTQKEISRELDYSSAQFISNFERGIAAPPTSRMKQLMTCLKIKRAERSRIVELYIDGYKAQLQKEF